MVIRFLMRCLAATCCIHILQLQAPQQLVAEGPYGISSSAALPSPHRRLTFTRRWVESGSKNPGITFFERLILRANQQQGGSAPETRTIFYPPKSNYEMTLTDTIVVEAMAVVLRAADSIAPGVWLGSNLM
jgi:hypothetical protein|tara:strand:- start:3944 stop:4336 length:393 start_codon:yes stop_codon:yes gene_type:complete